MGRLSFILTSVIYRDGGQIWNKSVPQNKKKLSIPANINYLEMKNV